MAIKYTGKYTQAFLSDNKINSESLESDFYNNVITVNSNEAVYVYSFKGNKMVFAKGFEKIINKKLEEINMLVLNEAFAPHFKKFINEYHDRLLLFLYNSNTNIESFSSHVIIRTNDFDNPLMLNIRVFKTDDNGNLVSVIGTNTIDKKLKTTDVIQYAFSGDFDPEFIDKINNHLDFQSCISFYNIQIIEHLNQGRTLAEIAELMNFEEQKVTNDLALIKKKFELKNDLELIEFAQKNHLIPNQFDAYLNK